MRVAEVQVQPCAREAVGEALGEGVRVEGPHAVPQLVDGSEGSAECRSQRIALQPVQDRDCLVEEADGRVARWGAGRLGGVSAFGQGPAVGIEGSRGSLR